jgi:hypothetical protein
VVYVTDMFRFRPLANKVQEELWGKGPYPPHNCRSASPQPGRHPGSGGNLLCPREKVMGGPARGLGVLPATRYIRLGRSARALRGRRGNSWRSTNSLKTRSRATTSCCS